MNVSGLVDSCAWLLLGFGIRSTILDGANELPWRSRETAGNLGWRGPDLNGSLQELAGKSGNRVAELAGGGRQATRLRRVALVRRAPRAIQVRDARQTTSAQVAGGVTTGRLRAVLTRDLTRGVPDCADELTGRLGDVVGDGARNGRKSRRAISRRWRGHPRDQAGEETGSGDHQSRKEL